MNANRTITAMFTSSAFEQLIRHLHETRDKESMAIGFYRSSESPTHLKLLVREIRTPKEADYFERSSGLVSLQPEFLEECFQYCETNRCHLLDIHTHPWSTTPEFSSIDDQQAAKVKIPYLRDYVSGVAIAFLLFGNTAEQVRGRIWKEPERQFSDMARIIVL
jgi:hypothetical protein